MKSLILLLISLGLSLSLAGCPADNTAIIDDPTPSPIPETGLAIEYEGHIYYESVIKAGVACFQKSGIDAAMTTATALEQQLEGAANDQQLKASLKGVLQTLLNTQKNHDLKCL